MILEVHFSPCTRYSRIEQPIVLRLQDSYDAYHAGHHSHIYPSQSDSSRYLLIKTNERGARSAPLVMSQSRVSRQNFYPKYLASTPQLIPWYMHICHWFVLFSYWSWSESHKRSQSWADSIMVVILDLHVHGSPHFQGSAGAPPPVRVPTSLSRLRQSRAPGSDEQ